MDSLIRDAEMDVCLEGIDWSETEVAVRVNVDFGYDRGSLPTDRGAALRLDMCVFILIVVFETEVLK